MVNKKTSRAPSKWKAIKIVLFTTSSFVLTWVPFFVASTWFVFCDSDQTPDLCRNLSLTIAGPLAILGFANSLMNPFIYAWWHQGFRQSFLSIWNRCCRCNHTEPITETNLLASSSTQNTNIHSMTGASTNELNYLSSS